MRYGTNHFLNADAAVAYYADQGIPAIDVARKLKDGEIAIGKPDAKPGQRVSLIPGEGRYQIEEGK